MQIWNENTHKRIIREPNASQLILMLDDYQYCENQSHV